MEKSAEIVIRPQRGWAPLNLRELWEFRGLLYFLTWKEVKVKYKQSLLGLAWVIFRPIISMAIFSLLFGRLGQFPSEGVPYPIFVFLGLLPWTFFSASLSESTMSLVTSTNLISKIYFPRVIIPMSAGLANLLDFMVSMSLLLIMMLYYEIVPGPGILLTPVLVVVIFVAMLGPGLLFSAVNVRYRDVKYIIPFLVQIWMFITPVIYPVSFIPEKYRLFMYLNPIAGPIEAFRAAVLGHTAINKEGLFISLGVSVFLFVAGLAYFKRVERTFADVI